MRGWDASGMQEVNRHMKILYAELLIWGVLKIKDFLSCVIIKLMHVGWLGLKLEWRNEIIF